MKENLEKLKELAQKSLDACATESGYTAGCHHFIDLWARDSFFACLGDLKSPNTTKTIDTFIKFQRKDGLIPYRIRRSKVTLKKYFGKPEMLGTPIADFRSFQSLGTVYDGGLMLLIALNEKYLKDNDIEYLKKYKSQVENTMTFYRKRFKDGLISEWVLCEWADAVFKFGNVLYTNVLYLKAVKSFIEIMKALNTSNQEIVFLEAFYNCLFDKFYSRFWNGNYFADWFDYKRQDFLAAFPNLLLIIWGLISDVEAHKIFKQISEKNLTELGVKSNFPQYPFWRIPLTNYIVGVGDYHNGIFWHQPWITYIMAAKNLKYYDIANKELEKYSEVMLRNEVIYENFEKDWKPLMRRFYRTEGPFAWSSGMILWMLEYNSKLTN